MDIDVKEQQDTFRCLLEGNDKIASMSQSAYNNNMTKMFSS
jgi:hypothetical protein